MVGLVAGHERCADGTELVIDTVDGRRRICVPSVADDAGAARVARTLRRVSVHLRATDHGWTSTVRGVGHRRNVTLPVSTPTALALVARGLPAVVHLP
jgi:hypothetical protein